MNPSQIGKYKLLRLIGEGGMASVYEAEHEMLGTKVAIKVLNPILSASAQIRERFKNEAKLMASLDHPNITKVIDFDDQPQQLSIIMEYLNGEDLSQKIKRNGALPENEIKEVFFQTLSTFQYAHEQGIVHRDIKPSNIFILPDGRVKILDFGIAKLYGQGNEMTQTGTQMGTPIYMSPEQVKADKSIDHRSDIYSLGVTMFYAINGKPPYNSETDSQFDIFSKIVFEPLPELSFGGNFNNMVKKACQKNREQRFQSCTEWIAALNAKETINRLSKDNTVIIGSEYDKTVIETTRKEPEIRDSETHKQSVFGAKSPSASAETYPEVIIGTQVWMKENLNLGKFRNGDPIPEAKTIEEWKRAGEAQQPAWCYYENDPVNGIKYGKLYNWYAVNDPRGLAPKGYHVPSDQEWTALIAHLGGERAAGTAMKKANGWFESGNGTNSSAFSGLPGGYRHFDGSFSLIGSHSFLWSSSESIKPDAWYRLLSYFNGNVLRNDDGKAGGFSVRCLRN